MYLHFNRALLLFTLLVEYHVSFLYCVSLLDPLYNVPPLIRNYFHWSLYISKLSYWFSVFSDLFAVYHYWTLTCTLLLAS